MPAPLLYSCSLLPYHHFIPCEREKKRRCKMPLLCMRTDEGKSLFILFLCKEEREPGERTRAFSHAKTTATKAAREKVGKCTTGREDVLAKASTPLCAWNLNFCHSLQCKASFPSRRQSCPNFCRHLQEDDRTGTTPKHHRSSLHVDLMHITCTESMLIRTPFSIHLGK